MTILSFVKIEPEILKSLGIKSQATTADLPNGTVAPNLVGEFGFFDLVKNDATLLNCSNVLKSSIRAIAKSAMLPANNNK